MSRGPGKWQRAILEAIEYHPDGIMMDAIPWLNTSSTPSRADYSACQRATHRLAKLGKCKLARVWCGNALDVRSAMISVYSPDAPDPEFVAHTHYETKAAWQQPKCGTRAHFPASTLTQEQSA